MLNDLVNKHYHLLTPTDFEIFKYIISNKEKVCELSIQDLANETFVSSASIVRFAKKIGLEGFSELKYQLRLDLEQSTPSNCNSISLLRNDVEETLDLMLAQNLDPIVKKIKSANKIFCFGTDWGEKLSVQFLSRNFMSNNIFMNIIPSITEMYWVLDQLSSDDLLIIVSFSGEDENLKKIITQLKSRNIPILSITPFSNNFLASEACYRMYYKSTPLGTISHPNTEYNFFTALHLSIDFLFRYYNDSNVL